VSDEDGSTPAATVTASAGGAAPGTGATGQQFPQITDPLAGTGATGKQFPQITDPVAGTDATGKQFPQITDPLAAATLVASAGAVAAADPVDTVQDAASPVDSTDKQTSDDSVADASNASASAAAAAAAASQLAAWLLGSAAVTPASTPGGASSQSSSASAASPGIPAAATGTTVAADTTSGAAIGAAVLNFSADPGNAGGSDNGASSGGNGAAADGAAPTPGTAVDLTALASVVHAAGVMSRAGGNDRSIAVPVFDSAWPHAVAAQVQLLASANVQNATLHLSPDHLGPVEVHIDLQSSQINVNFMAAHADTRSALEQSLPTLRAMLATGGLTLGQAHVQDQPRSGSHSAPSRTRSSAAAAAGETSIVAGVTRGVGLIDEYA
jgi:flagellar hook-length control protein FliK